MSYARAVEKVLRRRRGLDPHLLELLQKIVAVLDETTMLQRNLTDDTRPLADALRERLTSTRADHLNRETAAELYDYLERTTVTLAAEPYLRTAVTSELLLLSQDDAPIWQAVLTNERYPPPQLVNGKLPDADEARTWLLYVRRVRSEWQRRRWVRLRLKSQLLRRLAIGLTLLVALAGWAVDVAGAKLDEIVLVVATGALGAAVSGVYKLRDQVAAATAIRAFAPTVVAQVAVGAAAGLLVLFVIQTGLISGGDPQWAALGLAAFAAGFSEPFLLGIIGRAAGA